MALLSLREKAQLAGVVGLSCYLPLAHSPPIVSPENQATPLLMCHGTADPVVSNSVWMPNVSMTRVTYICLIQLYRVRQMHAHSWSSLAMPNAPSAKMMYMCYTDWMVDSTVLVVHDRAGSGGPSCKEIACRMQPIGHKADCSCCQWQGLHDLSMAQLLLRSRHPAYLKL